MHRLAERVLRFPHIWTGEARYGVRTRAGLSDSCKAASRLRATTPLIGLTGLALLTALGIVGGGNPGLAQTAGPTSDPLRGERRLLPIDDAVFTVFSDNGSDDQFTWILGGFNPPKAGPWAPATILPWAWSPARCSRCRGTRSLSQRMISP